MSHPLQLLISENEKLVYSHEFASPIELGRQDKGEEQPFHVHVMENGDHRITIARQDQQAIPRKFVRVEPVDGGKVRLTNLNAKQSLHLPDGTKLGHKASQEVLPPVVLKLSHLAVRIQGIDSDEEMLLHSLAEATVPPRLGSLPASLLGRLVPTGEAGATVPPGLGSLAPSLGTPVRGEGKAFVTWVHAALDVLQSAASSADFLDKAARAAAELLNLDSAQILLLGADKQFIPATRSSTLGREKDWQPSSKILARLLREKRTFWKSADFSGLGSGSLDDIKAVVAAPILNRPGEVIGALYGDRRANSPLAAFGSITELEASLIELLARGVAAGLARIEQERITLEARVRFEQFFTPQLARQLESNPDLLQGRDAEVTLLFCDIRGFSRISERLGPARTVAWINDTMAMLSECVRKHEGVLVDYIGDELMAMWGAPEEQPDHPRLACRAALDMLACLPELNGRWQTELKEPMSFGIGLNTGPAHVGNTGSPHKFKYGPLGNTVNLASRVQGATKYLKCRLLITGATQAKLDDSFVSRLLARVRVVNIDEPVDLYELSTADHPNWLQAKIEYEKALELFVKKEFMQAARALSNWRARMPDDGPALILIHRAITSEVEGAFDPIWDLPGK